jgi:hypothetical protein
MRREDRFPYAAGIWTQNGRFWEQNGGFFERSRHSTFELAMRAAIKYAKGRDAPTGGSLSWAGGVECPDETVHWYNSTGAKLEVWDRNGNAIEGSSEVWKAGKAEVES